MTLPAAIVTPLTPIATRMEDSAAHNRGVAISRLTAALAAGDDEAFREFHSAYFDRLLRYLFVVARGDEEVARDALQETFTRVVRLIRPFDSEQVFWNWVTLLARSAAADVRRKRTRYWRMLTRYACFWKPAQQNTEDDIELETLLVAAMEVLDANDRSLIEGKYFSGLSVRELAARSELTEKAVESRLARARRRLREELSKRILDEKTDRT